MQSSSLMVDLAERSYPIVIEDQALGRVKAYLDHYVGAEKYFCVTDETVAGLYLERLEDQVSLSGTYVCSPGEAAKSFTIYEDICEKFLEQSMTRNSAIIALGGGVVGDLTGFVASTVLRGVRFVQIPTTLLAQVDSSVGGKTAINSKAGKNLIGAFYQPELVIVDTHVLKTLPQRQMYAGYGEILKYALIDDPEFFEWLDENAEKVLGGDSTALSKAIRKSCEKKAGIVAADERESGQRALLNLGHTFAHALEKEAGYDGALLHGEAVLMGMMMAMEFSVDLGMCDPQDLQRLKDHYNRYGLMPDYKIKSDADRLIDIMGKDKKNIADTIVFILLRGIGKAYVETSVPRDTAKEFLVKFLKAIQS